MTGFPWNPGDPLLAADLNAAIATSGGGGGGGTSPYTTVNTAGSIALGGVAQQLVGANSARIGLVLQTLTGDLWYNGSGAATPNGDSEFMPAGSQRDFGAFVGALSGYAASTGQKYVIIEKFAA